MENENKGWICPKCGQVYSPNIEKCGTCGPEPVKEGTEKKKELLKD